MTTPYEFLDAAIRMIGNRYLTTMLIAKRIRQLQHGAKPLVLHSEDESPFSVAVHEIAEGLITLNPDAPPEPKVVTEPTQAKEEKPAEAAVLLDNDMPPPAPTASEPPDTSATSDVALLASDESQT